LSRNWCVSKSRFAIKSTGVSEMNNATKKTIASGHIFADPKRFL